MKREYQLSFKNETAFIGLFSENDTQSSKDFVSLPPKKNAEKRQL